MSTKRDRDLERYFDGELGPRQTRAVRETLEQSAEDRNRLAALEATRAALRQHTRDAAEQADFGRLWSGIQRGIQSEAPLTLGERVGLWFRRYGLVVGSAAAAAVLLVAILLWPAGEPPPRRHEVVIESLDVGPEAVGTIFTVADPVDKVETTVIWVTETPADATDADPAEGEL